MKIELWPDFTGPQSVHVSGDKIYLDGVEFDFSRLKQGELLPLSAVDSPQFIGTEFAERIGGELKVHIRLKVGFDTPSEVANPASRLILTGTTGLVELPSVLPPKGDQPSIPSEGIFQ